MLDALMGNDRNDYIPNISTARPSGECDDPTKKNTRQSNKNKKTSCFDRDVCPYYTAWGVDVFELFVNTKSASDVNSHLGIRPPNQKCSDDAHTEFMELSEEEKERLGYERMLHAKLKGLVASANRTVARNKEKLRQEIARNKKSQAATAAVHQTVSSVSAEQLGIAADLQAKLDDCEEEIDVLVKELKELQAEKQLKIKVAQDRKEEEEKDVTVMEEVKDVVAEETNANANTNETVEEPETSNKMNIDDEKEKEKKTDEPSSTPTTAPLSPKEESSSSNSNTTTKIDAENNIKETKLIESIMQKIMEVAPLKEQIFSVKRSLYYIRADFQTDKTVCEVSGNFMSSRDADERIAAHYAGKQYVGWKMVREKCKALDEKYRSLPPPPRGQQYGYDRRRSPDRGGYHDRRGGYGISRHHRSQPPHHDDSRGRDRGYNGNNAGGYNNRRGAGYGDRDRGGGYNNAGGRDSSRGRKW